MWIIQLLEYLKTIFHRLTCWVVIDEYDRGVVLRLGKFSKELEPGLSFKFPIIDKVISATVVISTIRLDPQTVHTKDDVQVTFIMIIKYSIRKIKPYLLDIVDREDVLGDVGPCVAKEMISGMDYSVFKKGIEEEVKKKLRQEVNQYGFHVHKITFATQAKIKSLRLITTPFESKLE